jgi:hypothetical protein
MLVQVLTNIINRKAREDLQLEGELDFPFYIPSSGEVLDQGTYFCALRVAIKHLELTRRAIVYDIRAKYQVKVLLISGLVYETRSQAFSLKLYNCATHSLVHAGILLSLSRRTTRWTINESVWS